MKTTKASKNIDLQATLLQWYAQNKREMPWRATGEMLADPYAVWMSEIMLQQTTVAAVISYFEKFIKRWPRVQDLAAAEQDDVLQMWAGLGYYARARNLHKCAQIIVSDFGGAFPQERKLLLSLPGVGPYTAAAIASIAFDQDYVAVDGNVERVVSRLYAVDDPLPAAKPQLKEYAERLGAENKKPSDFTQAFMELGATVCKPKSPICDLCPWQGACKAYTMGDPLGYPKRIKKHPKPKRYGTVFWVENAKGDVWVRQRPQKGLLGGMMEFPSSEWRERAAKKTAEGFDLPQFLRDEKFVACVDVVKHVFTHFELYLTVHHYVLSDVPNLEQGQWVPPGDFKSYALPSLMIKVAKLALNKA